MAKDDKGARDVMDELLESNYVYYLNTNLKPNEANLLCRFRKDNPDHGHPPDKTRNWGLVLKQAKTNSYIPLKGVTDFHEKNPYITSMYLDTHNCKLYDAIRPLEWIDPLGTEPYDLLVLGAGPGGIAAAIRATQLGFKVGLVERGYFGGEHFNTGMITFEALEQCAEVIHKLAQSRVPGLEIQPDSWNLNLKKVMEHVRAQRAQITPLFCNIYVLTETYGIDVYLGNARFVSPHQVTVNDKVLDFAKCVVAVGAHPTIPKLEGLMSVPYYTTDTILNMTRRPSSLVIYGSGQVACAYAQVFHRLQIPVTLLSESNKLLEGEAMEDFHKYVEHTLKDLGVKVLTGATVRKIEPKKPDARAEAKAEPKPISATPSEIILDVDARGARVVLECQALLVATQKTVKIDSTI
jgi:pyruvate/2-oxoglutarate dehydrogenase complex dihydrolipoamide dehydrogenase (E3) component